MEKISSNKFLKLSFYMTVAMVFYHFSFFKPATEISGVDETIFRFFSDFFDMLGIAAMGYFFLATGFLLFYKMDEKNVGEKLKRRVFSLLIPYLVWNVLYYGFFLIVYKKDYLFGPLELAKRFVFLPFDAPLWYVLAVFVLALLSPLFLLFRKNRGLGIGILFILSALSFYGSAIMRYPIIKSSSIGFYFERILRYMPDYLLGLGIALYAPKWADLKSKIGQWIARIFLIVSMVICIYAPVPFALIWIIQRLQPVALWFVVVGDTKEYGKEHYYHSAFMVYALHAGIIFVVEHIFDILTISSGSVAILLRIAFVFAMVALSVGIWYFMKKLLPKTLGILTGNRG